MPLRRLQDRLARLRDDVRAVQAEAHAPGGRGLVHTGDRARERD